MSGITGNAWVDVSIFGVLNLHDLLMITQSALFYFIHVLIRGVNHWKKSRKKIYKKSRTDSFEWFTPRSESLFFLFVTTPGSIPVFHRQQQGSNNQSDWHHQVTNMHTSWSRAQCHSERRNQLWQVHQTWSSTNYGTLYQCLLPGTKLLSKSSLYFSTSLQIVWFCMYTCVLFC